MYKTFTPKFPFASSLIVLVQHIPKEEISAYRKESFVELYAKLMERHRARAVSEAQGPETRRDPSERDAEAEEPRGSSRQKRRVEADCKNRDGEYIAGIFDNEVKMGLNLGTSFLEYFKSVLIGFCYDE